MGRGSRFARDSKPKSIAPRVIIACEGEACEKLYFDGIRKDLKLPKDQIKVLPHRGTDPVTIVNVALDGIKEAKAERNWVKERDQAWAVYDVDDKLRENPGLWNTALQRAHGRVRLAISSPAFELWYLLHFVDQQAYIDRRTARGMLERLINYEKSQSLYPELKATLGVAIERAERLEVLHQSVRPDTKHPNPSTGVWALVSDLVKLEDP
jgi:hypothetical protein